MLRLPSARAPNSMRPCIQATILLSFNCATAASISSSVGQQVMEAQLAVLEHLLGFGRRRRPGPEQSVSSAHARVLAESAVPGFERRADGRARHCPPPAARRRSRSRTRFSSAETSSALSPRPPARHRLRPLAGHADHGRLRRPSGCPRPRGRAQRFGNRRAVRQAQALVEPRAEAAA